MYEKPRINLPEADSSAVIISVLKLCHVLGLS